MEVIWLVLAILLLLGISIAYWQRRLRANRESVSPQLQPLLWDQTPKSQPNELLGLYPLPTELCPLSPVSKNQGFSNLKSQLQELANLGWAKNESSWYLKFSLHPRDISEAISAERVIEILLNHAMRVTPEFSIPQMVPRVLVESIPFAAGEFVVDEDGWVTIKVSPHFFNDKPAAHAILAHEVCHYILENSGIRHGDFEVNERYTDLCMFICGFGEIFLAGYKRESAQNDYRPGHRLGYLTAPEYEFANQYVVELYQSKKLTLNSELDRLRTRLSQLLYGDRDKCRRLIEAQRRRSPHKSEVDLYQDAIDRLIRDRGR